ncbi:hypothetical protein VTK73DRAFT_4454 [Phialemonium thermophilum]|uniref:tRNA-guanine(15) transglycosylase-like domain-containing protein n=1 Tax=Phialemonium thermophilum TaxID=223376 RepID=A0ABR3V8L7_9PEZI
MYPRYLTVLGVPATRSRKLTAPARTMWRRRMASTVPAASSASASALTFELVAKCSTSRARASLLTLPHGPVQLPVFMPVATQASLKGLTPEQLEETGCRLCLNNTYHLGLKPGQQPQPSHG